MEKVKNASGKLVCMVDKEKLKVEIAKKKNITIIQFLPNGDVEIKNKHIT